MDKSLQFLGSMIIGVFIAAAVFFLVYGLPPTKSKDLSDVVPNDNDSFQEPESSEENRQLYDFIDFPELQSPTDLIVQLLPRVEQMDQQSLEKLFEQISLKSRNRQQQSLEQLVIHHLAEVDPKIAFETIINLDYFKQEQLLPTLMSRWSQGSLEDALTAAATLEGDVRLSALKSALSTLSDEAHKTALEFAIDLGIEPKVKQALSAVKIRKAMHNPREAFELAMTDEVPDEDQLDLFSEATELWLSTEGIKAYPQLFEILRTQSSTGRSSWQYFYGLVYQMVELDPPHMWEMVENEYQDLRDSLRRLILGRWVQIDIDGAQAAIQELDQDEYVEELYRDMIRYGLSDDPLNLAQQVEKFPQGHRAYLLKEAIFSLALEGEIDTVFEILKQMEHKELNTNRAIELLIKGWIGHDVVAAIHWVLENFEKGSDMQSSLLISNIRDYAEFDPDRAFTVAIEYDDSRYVGSTTSLPIMVIGWVAYLGDFATARRLLDQLGKPQSFLGHYEIGVRLLRNGRIDETIELGNELPDPMQVQYYDRLAYSWIMTDTVDFLDRFSNFTNEAVQSVMANQVLGDRRLRKLLSSEEIAYLEEYSTLEEEE